MKKWKLVAAIAMMMLFMVACGKEDKETSEKTTPTVTQAADEVSTSTPEATPTEEAVPTVEPTPTAKPTSTPKPTPTTTPQVSEKIKEVYAPYGLKAGTCMSEYMAGNEQCMDFIKEHFNSITFENELKPEAILNQQASKDAGDLVVSFGPGTIKLLDWCKENGMAVRGHTLIWYSQTPNWIFYDNFEESGNFVDRETMLSRMESYIRQVFELLESMGYIEMFYAYDVVNEAWMEDGTKRNCHWLNIIGDDYMWYAFKFADQYAPDYIDLYYNDYNEQYKTNALYEFVQTLKDENGEYLIDGIGFQAHLYTQDNLKDYFATADKLGSLGIKVNLTELDVCLGKWQVPKYATDPNLKVQGKFYYDLISGLLQRVKDGKVKMDSLTFWGFSDELSWRKEYNPCLLNRKFEPKYAFFAALQMKEYAGYDE